MKDGGRIGDYFKVGQKIKCTMSVYDKVCTKGKVYEVVSHHEEPSILCNDGDYGYRFASSFEAVPQIYLGGE